MIKGLELKDEFTRDKIGFENLLKTFNKIEKVDLDLPENFEEIKNALETIIEKNNRIEAKTKKGTIIFIQSKNVFNIIRQIKKILKNLNIEDLKDDLKLAEEIILLEKEKVNNTEKIADSIRDKNIIKKQVERIELLQEIIDEIKIYSNKIKNKLDNKSEEKTTPKIQENKTVTKPKPKKLEPSTQESKPKTAQVETKIYQPKQETETFNSIGDFKEEFEKIGKLDYTEKDFLNKLNKEYTNLEDNLKLEICDFLYEKNFINKDVLSNLFIQIKIKNLDEKNGNKWHELNSYINEEILNNDTQINDKEQEQTKPIEETENNKIEEEINGELKENYDLYMIGKLRGAGSKNKVIKLIEELPIQLFIKLLKKDKKNLKIKNDEYINAIETRIIGEKEEINEIKGEKFIEEIKKIIKSRNSFSNRKQYRTKAITLKGKKLEVAQFNGTLNLHFSNFKKEDKISDFLIEYINENLEKKEFIEIFTNKILDFSEYTIKNFFAELKNKEINNIFYKNIKKYLEKNTFDESEKNENKIKILEQIENISSNIIPTVETVQEDIEQRNNIEPTIIDKNSNPQNVLEKEINEEPELTLEDLLKIVKKNIIDYTQIFKLQNDTEYLINLYKKRLSPNFSNIDKNKNFNDEQKKEFYLSLRDAFIRNIDNFSKNNKILKKIKTLDEKIHNYDKKHIFYNYEQKKESENNINISEKNLKEDKQPQNNTNITEKNLEEEKPLEKNNIPLDKTVTNKENLDSLDFEDINIERIQEFLINLKNQLQTKEGLERIISKIKSFEEVDKKKLLNILFLGETKNFIQLISFLITDIENIEEKYKTIIESLESEIKALKNENEKLKSENQELVNNSEIGKNKIEETKIEVDKKQSKNSVNKSKEDNLSDKEFFLKYGYKKLILKYQPGIVNFANKKGALPGMTIDDLISELNIEVTKLAKKYNPEKNDNFWGYIYKRLNGKYGDLTRKEDSISRNARNIIKQITKHLETNNKIEGIHNLNIIKAKEILKNINPKNTYSDKMIQEALNHGNNGSNKVELKNEYFDLFNIYNPTEKIIDEIEKEKQLKIIDETLKKYKSKNTERDLKIFYERIYSGNSLKNIGEKYTISEARISLIYKKIKNFIIESFKKPVINSTPKKIKKTTKGNKAKTPEKIKDRIFSKNIPKSVEKKEKTPEEIEKIILTNLSAKGIRASDKKTWYNVGIEKLKDKEGPFSIEFSKSIIAKLKNSDITKFYREEKIPNTDEIKYKLYNTFTSENRIFAEEENIELFREIANFKISTIPLNKPLQIEEVKTIFKQKTKNDL